MSKQNINICWIRRDLRLEDNAALHHALKSENQVLLLFIFDKNILDKLSDRTDARVTFIYETILQLNKRLKAYQTSILVKYGTPETIWSEVLTTYNVSCVFSNHDYEPYARERDSALAKFFHSKNIVFRTFKDQVVFEKNEVIKTDGKPYTVFTPYFRQWQQKLNDYYLKPYPSDKYFDNFLNSPSFEMPSLQQMGFEKSSRKLPGTDFENRLTDYENKRDYPAADATTHIGIHLRFGTISIRHAAHEALAQNARKWLSELAWRDFYMMILWHFPHTVNKSFKPAYDNIRWRNNVEEFSAWCEGRTGYPIVDAGMRQLNQTGYMHNRVRMIVASFLTKHLLIDWRWGESYFAEKLLDYEMASNVGGWQWACGCGNDAAPYFRVFNPELQTRKFDPDYKYIYKWAPEYKQQKHIKPIVEHAFARERILKVFREALNQ